MNQYLPAKNHLALAVAAATLGISPASVAAPNDLEQRVETLEQQVTGQSGGIGHALQWSGLIEVEGFSAEDYNGDSTSNFELATVELGLEAQVNDYVSSNVLLLYEENASDDIGVDEATLTIAPPGAAWSSTFGRQYVPFGSFETGLVSDPLPLEIGETRETSALVEFGTSNLNGSVYAFNGDTEDDSADDTIGQFGASVAFQGGSEDMPVNVGAGYISSIGDSDGVSIGSVNDHVGAYDLSATVGVGPFTVIGEYLAAADSFEASELAFDGNGAEPVAYQLELGYGFEWGGMPASVNVSTQGTDEAVALGLPETRFLAGISVEPWKATSISVEFASDDDYDTSDGGTGESADSVVVQLATGF